MRLTNRRSDIVQIRPLICLLLISHVQGVKGIRLDVLIPISNAI